MKLQDAAHHGAGFEIGSDGRECLNQTLSAQRQKNEGSLARTLRRRLNEAISHLSALSGPSSVEVWIPAEDSAEHVNRPQPKRERAAPLSESKHRRYWPLSHVP